MINSQEDYSKELIKHLNKLKEIAAKDQPTELLKKIKRYYRGAFDKAKDKTSNQRNIIKNMVETKVTAVLDGQIKTTVVPSTKNNADLKSIVTARDLSEIMDDCVQEVFRHNNYDTWRESMVRDQVLKLGVNETVIEDGQIKLHKKGFRDFFPDPSASCIQDCNYIFLREWWSPITLKSKYPQLAEKIDKLTQDTEKGEKGEPTKIITATVSSQTNQAFVYNDPGAILKNAKDVLVWKVYLKDDSTFTAEELVAKGEVEQENMEQLKAKFPNGRMIMYCDKSKDLVLEDKAIDYPFGYPLDLCFNIKGDYIWDCIGEVEDLFENQDRTNNAYRAAKDMVGKFGSWILNDPKSGIKKGDYVNKTVLEGDNVSQYPPTTLTNNTLNKFNVMIEYLDVLKKDAYDIARLNEQMVSGNQEDQTTSGEQVKALNEHPMSGIRALQRNYKDFLVSVTNKIIVLIQKYYNTQRIIRATAGKYYKLPTKGAVGPDGQPIPIEVYEEKNGLIEKIEEIRGDLSLAQFEVEVIAGSERPRSRSENANLMMSLFQSGFFGQDLETKKMIMEELDVPNRREIGKRMEEKEKNMPPPLPSDSPETAKAFKDTMDALTGFTPAKQQLLKQIGLVDEAGQPAMPDTLDTAPVQETTKQSEVHDVAMVAPQVISNNLEHQARGQQTAAIVTMKDKIGEQNAEPAPVQ